jgi:biopolymer transport protein ExbD
MNDAISVPVLAGPASSHGDRNGPPQRRRSLFRLIGAEPATFSEINTTPLIDVMLVLLIMFIITIPAATHKVPLDLPSSRLDPVPVRRFHQLDIAANGSLSWNGGALPDGQLEARLLRLAADPNLPELRLNAASEARFDRIDQILAQIRLAGVERLGFVGNERYARAF